MYSAAATACKYSIVWGIKKNNNAVYGNREEGRADGYSKREIDH